MAKFKNLSDVSQGAAWRGGAAAEIEAIERAHEECAAVRRGYGAVRRSYGEKWSSLARDFDFIVIGFICCGVIFLAVSG